MNKANNISMNSAANGKRLVVLGAGESGVGAAYLAQQQGYDVLLINTKRSSKVGT
jgi:UDP-N-acetylmuramoylalanine--D-glutamate ligase